jgi:hypothetical protein
MALDESSRYMFGRREGPTEMVPFLDTESGRIVRIPASELRQGAIQVRLAETDELVWVLADQIKESEVRHPPFSEDVCVHIRHIQAAFAEHRPLPFEQWEEGFRRDAHPDREIAVWLHATDVYEAFAGEEPSPERRQDVFRVIVACLTSSPEMVWRFLQLTVLTRPEAEQIVQRYFGNPT